MSLPLVVTVRLLLTILLVWALQAYANPYILITGGLPAWIVIGSLLTLLNLLVRPVLNVITAPIHFVAAMFAFILVNGIFTGIVLWIASHLEPDLVILQIKGLAGWIVIPAILGISNWIITAVTHLVKASK